MLLMTEPTFFWNLISNRQDDKGTFLGHMKQWITDVAKSGKSKWPLQRITSSSTTASSTHISSFSHPTATLKTTASSSAPKPPPSCSPTPLSAEDEPPAVLLDDNDAVQREAAHLLMNLHKSPAADWQISQSKDKDIDYGQPPFTQKPTIAPMSVKAEPMDIPVDVTNNFSDSDDDLIIINAPPVATTRSTMLTGRKRTTTIVQAADHGDMPSSKCPRTKPPSVDDRTGGECSTRKVKYNNSHLPQGVRMDNQWHGTLIPTYAKWNRMLNICWGTKSSFEVEVLQLLWDVIYKHKVPASIQSDDLIHAVATQRIVEWRGRFASASILMIYSLINSNERFNSPEGQSELANFWLEGNRFLFKDVTGDSVKDYKGMLKSPLILQIFAVHMHFIQGAMDIPIDTGLKGNKYGHLKAALSLAGAVSTKGIPPKVWDEIIDATLQFVKETMRKPGRGVSSNDEDNTRALSDDDRDKFTDLMTYH
ncbi:hypothetical protein BS17DRAFT_808271 [Gyrodon lividus]|nr:hypothetical protein BS17DRAFT_808271 [Gyrodon lividus]